MSETEATTEESTTRQKEVPIDWEENPPPNSPCLVVLADTGGVSGTCEVNEIVTREYDETGGTVRNVVSFIEHDETEGRIISSEQAEELSAIGFYPIALKGDETTQHEIAFAREYNLSGDEAAQGLIKSMNDNELGLSVDKIHERQNQ
jgi:hypothetical protein